MDETREEFKERITSLWGEVYAEAMYEERNDPDARPLCQNAATMAVYTQAIRDVMSDLGRDSHRSYRHRHAMERLARFALKRGIKVGGEAMSWVPSYWAEKDRDEAEEANSAAESPPGRLGEASSGEHSELVLWVTTGDDKKLVETHLTGTLIGGQFVIPFGSSENAVDCLRIVTQSVRQIEDK